eukprot:1715084-Alexandrium_andersonii.AAC.1
MSASLVGSEMCIRDSREAAPKVALSERSRPLYGSARGLSRALPEGSANAPSKVPADILGSRHVPRSIGHNSFGCKGPNRLFW